MRTIPFLALFALGCPSGTLTVPKTTTTGLTGPTTPTDTDADIDTDTDSDADADSDADTDTTTTDTGTPPVVDPPDWVVDCNGNGDFTTIQAAINAAITGDRIEVNACVYRERIDFIGKGLDVYSAMGSAVTVIDGQGQGTVVDIESGEPDGTRLAGFTITGGDDNDDGAAMEVEYSNIDLFDLYITGNDGLAMIHARAGIIDMHNVVIEGNTIASDGQAIYSKGGGLSASDVAIACDGGSEAIYHHNVLVLTDSTITCRNGSYGIHNYHGEDRIVRSTISGAVAGIYAYDVESTTEEPDTPNEHFLLDNSVVVGGQFGVDVRYMDVEIRNVVLSGADAALTVLGLQAGSSAEGSAFVGAACGIASDAAFSATNSAFWDNAADGCGLNVNPAVTGNPLFVAFPTDVTLRAGSPLIDTGPSDADRRDVDGSRNDIGAHGGPLPL